MLSKRLSKEKAIERLRWLYSGVLEEIDNMRELTPFKNIERFIIKTFSDCFRGEMFNKYYELLEEIENKDGIGELELEEKIEDAIVELEGLCYEYVEEKINEYLETLESEAEAESLKTELECYLEYVYKELPRLTP